MTENGNISQYNPTDHLVQIKTKDGLKPFLKATSALNWFYAENPLGKGRIITEIMQIEPPVVRAEIWVEGVKVATGHANSDGNSNTLKKIESAAIRRALANAGYGTDQVVARLARSVGVDEAKKLLGSNKAEGERRMGGTEVNHKRADLETWALVNVYAQNKIHMNASLKKLAETGKLSSSLTLDEAKKAVLDRHVNDMELEQGPNPFDSASDIAAAI